MLRFDKFTVKSQETIQNTMNLAAELQHQQIERQITLRIQTAEEKDAKVWCRCFWKKSDVRFGFIGTAGGNVAFLP